MSVPTKGASDSARETISEYTPEAPIVVRGVTERPILFSGPMVRALLDGTKTQTRRVVTSNNSLFDGSRWPTRVEREQFAWDRACVDPGPSPAANSGPCLKLQWPKACGDETTHRVYPRIQPGDRLWVRETWQPIWASSEPPPHGESSAEGWAIGYVATDGVQEWQDEDRRSVRTCNPPRSMPRWASRITLEVTEVRVERLVAISVSDSLAEGMIAPVIGEAYGWDPRDAYRAFWDAMDEKRWFGWDTNPWVWVIAFDRV